MVEQCKHTRRTGVMSMHRCEHKAVRDGYCTRHQHDYWSPKDWAALSDEDREEFIARGQGPVSIKGADRNVTR